MGQSTSCLVPKQMGGSLSMRQDCIKMNKTRVLKIRPTKWGQILHVNAWLLGLLGVLLMAGTSHAFAIEFWFAPIDWTGPTSTQIEKTSREKPYPYPTSPKGNSRSALGDRAEAFAKLFRRVLGGEFMPPGDTELTVEFIPGIFPTTPLYPTSGWLGTSNHAQMLATTLTLRNGWGMDTNSKPVVLQLVLDAGANWPEYAGNQWQNLGIMMLNSYSADATRFMHPARFIAEDLIFDCNWDGLGLWSSPFHNGFKVFGLAAGGRTGRLTRVKVINAGSSGMAPNPPAATSGVEGFPISVVATDFFQKPFPGSGELTPWVIEQCEVTDFHSMRAGYCCAISIGPRFPGAVRGQIVPGFAGTEDRIDESLRSQYPGCTWWYEVLDIPANRSLRFATVRQCFTSVFGAGFGVAFSGGIRMEDNIVINGSALNCDTGHCRNIDVVNNVWLDVCKAVNVGSWNPNSGPMFFQNWSLTGNLIRIDRRPGLWDYTSHTYNPRKKVFERRPLSSQLPTYINDDNSYAFALGSCNTMDLSGNRVTTRPRAAFNETNPRDKSGAIFRLVSRPTEVSFWGYGVDQSRSAPKMDGFQLSGVAYDFRRLTPVPASDSQRYSNNPAISRGPADLATNGFFGTVRRVERATENGHLLGVKEVAISTPVRNPDGTTVVQARWAYHPTPLNTVRLETTSLAPGLILFKVEDARGNPVALPPPSHIGHISTLPLPNNLPDGYYRIVAYVPAPGTVGGSFDPTRDAWSETEYLKGTTVRFGSCPDLADDSVPVSGTLLLKRTGKGAFTARIKQLTGFGRDATYGTDFTMAINGVPITPAADGVFSIPFIENEASKSVEVRVIKDAEMEWEAVVFTILDGGIQYGTAPSQDWVGYPPTRASVQPGIYPDGSWKFSASVLIYDGDR